MWTTNGARLSEVDGALDCDLGYCSLTNTMPVLRHDLLTSPGTHELLMAWVSVPDLTVSANRQTYTHRTREDGGARIRYESGSFRSDVLFDSDGLVVDYPQLATRRRDP